jgi:hypothetical protein
MPGISVFITSPANGSIIGRSQLFTGQVSPFNGSVWWVELQFGDNGPTRSATNPNGGFAFGWQGLIPNEVRPGQTFNLRVRAGGSMITRPGPEPESEPVDGERMYTFTLENVVPQLTIDAFQSPIAILGTAPLTLPIAGNVTEGNGPPYTTPTARYRIDNGAWVNAAISGSRWSASLSLAPGQYTLTVQAFDQFASVTTLTRSIVVYRYPLPSPIDPAAKKTPLELPTTASITSWTRLEPQCAGIDIGLASSARLFDPLWQMARQWQIGEFQGEDSGTPVKARVRATNAWLSRLRLGPLRSAHATAQPYDPGSVPLETLVERRRMRASAPDEARQLTLAVDAGLHFLRLLDSKVATKKYRANFISVYRLVQELGAEVPADDVVRRQLQLMIGRAPDARRLAAGFRPPNATTITLDPRLNIAAADVAAVTDFAQAWLAWYDGLFSDPAAADEQAWTPERLEYSLAVAARLSATPQDTLTFTASQFDGGRLDWSSFDVANDGTGLNTDTDTGYSALNAVSVPATINVRGAPAARFWELEDATVAFGLLSAGPTDLAHLMMVEYASTYGNDWYLVPLNTPVGSVTRIDSLVVTDNFGVRTLVRPIGDPGLEPPFFSLWQPSHGPRPEQRLGQPVINRFLLPPTLGQSIDSAPLEDVLMLRDEMANMAWAIERSVEGPTEQPVVRISTPTVAPLPPVTGAAPAYRLASPVPDNWIPLLPVQVTTTGNKLEQRLQRAKLLQVNGPPHFNVAHGEALNAGVPALMLFDEEIPREGVRVSKSRRMTRWSDGSSWVWTALRREVGRGEGSSGLTYDRLQSPDNELPRPEPSGE